MINIEILEKITLDCVVNNPEKLFVVGDNFTEPNIINFSIYENNIESYRNSIIEKIILIKSKSNYYNSVVLCSKGYCKNSPPELVQFINDLMRYNFDFDNSLGTKWIKIPSHHEITNCDYFNLSNFNSNLIIPPNNSYFKSIFLENGLYTLYDLIKTDNKIAFTSKDNFQVGQNLIFQFSNQNNYILCRITCCYPADSLSSEVWSDFEGLNPNYRNSIDLTNFKQYHIRFIAELDHSGKMIFRNDIFKDSNPPEKNENITTIPDNITNVDIYKLLLELSSKIDKLLK